ncbi:MAG TPA: hypothetical protein VM686_42625, partial [Polyangiaceae bacterium]|nr:hypothetical protein [Polyangiaceae bacterium]
MTRVLAVAAAMTVFGCSGGQGATEDRDTGAEAVLIGGDSLYVADADDNTIKRFDATTGQYKGAFVKKGNSPLKGPMGLIVESHGDLLIAN